MAYRRLINRISLAMSLLLITAPANAQSIHKRSIPGIRIAQVQQNAPTSQLQLRGTAPDAPVDESMEQIRATADETMGAVFMEPDQLTVKQPVLKALIQLNSQLSPYQLDADSQTPIDLRDALQTALDNNLPLKISQSDQESSRWQYYSSLGGFLPNLINGFGYQVIAGKFASPFGVLAPVNGPFLVAPSAITYNFFKGGGILYTALQNKHKYKASQYALKGTTNDVLFDVDRLYYQLVLNDVLLQIRVKAVETSETLYKRNQIRYENGANTKLDLLQAKTQLSQDRQKLINQQVARRQAAVDLATALDLNPASDLILQNRLVKKIRLIDPNLRAGDLLKIAIDNRPELKKYEQLRLAAKDAIKVARAPLLPSVTGAAIAATTGAKVSRSNSSAALQNTAVVGSFGVEPFGTTSASPLGVGSGGVKFNATEVFTLGIDIEWSLDGLGLTDIAKVKSAKWQARKAQDEFNLELAKVYQEVRNTYLDSMAAENLINETTDTVNSAREQLDVATTRTEEGVGIDLDVVNAQRDYTNALTDKANAIIKYNTAQAAMLRSLGRISLDTLTSISPLNQ